MPPTGRRPAGRPSDRARRQSWREAIDHAAGVVARAEQGRVSTAEVARAAARLVDTVHRDHVRRLLQGAEPAAIERSPELSFARAAIAAAEEDADEALRWLARAQACLRPSDRELAARIAFELGSVHLRRSERRAADAAVAWAEGWLGVAEAASYADLLLLRALMAKNVGDSRLAIPLYRNAIATSAPAFSPVTRVLALINLAVALHHANPAEGLALCTQALAVVDGHLLTPTIRPAILNISAYASICLGRTDRARESAGRAEAEASAVGDRRVHLYAMFNTAIVDELEERLDDALVRLERVNELAIERRMNDLATWAQIRISWLRLKSGGPDAARLSGPLAHQLPEHYAEAVETLRALIEFVAGELDPARVRLRSLTRSYLLKDDMLTAFVLLLWSSCLETRAGRRDAARRLLKQACDIGSRHGFVCSPNWWARDIVDQARHLAAKEDQDHVRSLLVVGPAIAERQLRERVAFTWDGQIFIEGRPVDAELWRFGRTGSRVLRRYFAILAKAHPVAVPRDELAAALWPDSEGDRAIRDLYAATNDLRRVLASIPGLGLEVEGGTYRLSLAPNASRLDPSAT